MATVLPILTLTALGQSVAYPAVAALISRATDPSHQGQMLGLNNAGGSAARVVGPLCAGLAFSGLHEDAPFWIGAVAVLPAIGLAWSTRRPRPR
jgi:MFS family permease